MKKVNYAVRLHFNLSGYKLQYRLTRTGWMPRAFGWKTIKRSDEYTSMLANWETALRIVLDDPGEVLDEKEVFWRTVAEVNRILEANLKGE